MKQLSREHAAAHSFETAANNFRNILGFANDASLASFYDVFVGAIANFVLCELNMRQAERCLVAGIQKGRARDLRDMASKMNNLGIASLESSFAFLEDVEKIYGSKLSVEQLREMIALIREFNNNVTLILVDHEIKASDLAMK
jgi:hypothetical protein